MLALWLMSSAFLSAAPPRAAVLEPVANMHAQPADDAEVVSQAIYGTPLELLEQRGAWAKVQTPDGYTGWMNSRAFRAVPTGAEQYASDGRVAEVESLFANLYGEPDVTKHAPLATVPFETRLEVISEADQNERRWIQVRLVDGRAAWLQQGDAAFDPPKLPVSALPEFARRFLGLPYLWGGTSTFGYDCSGFVQMLYRRAGVLLPRDAQPQAGWEGLARVERNDLRPGDLVYFGASERKITHTGLYLGDGQFISATVHERPVVRIDRLADPFWTKLYAGGRRLK
ncbi:MAG: NlpC/P60 family protein [Bryobacteraceae bacterium]|jgi:cell wall-associated NlpC family hydrolase